MKAICAVQFIRYHWKMSFQSVKKLFEEYFELEKCLGISMLIIVSYSRIWSFNSEVFLKYCHFQCSEFVKIKFYSKIAPNCIASLLAICGDSSRVEPKTVFYDIYSCFDQHQTKSKISCMSCFPKYDISSHFLHISGRG